MKLITVPILMLLILIQSFTRPLIFMDFQINRSFISSVLCENKASTQCNGKCQLIKKLATEDKKSSQSTIIVKYQEVLFTIDIDQAVMLYATATENKWFSGSDGLLSQRAFSIFHPPCSPDLFFI